MSRTTVVPDTSTGAMVTDVPAGLRITTAGNIGEALQVLKSITDNGGQSKEARWR